MLTALRTNPVDGWMEDGTVFSAGLMSRDIEDVLRDNQQMARIGTYVEGEWRQLNTNILQIENEYYTTGSKVTEIETVEIEHVAPRKSYRAKKYSTWPQYLGVSEESFEENCNKIGNLTLLNERMNARAQDNPFRQKKREYEGSEFEMTKEICDYEDWSIENIEKRTEKLAEIAPKIWDFDK